MDVKRNVVGLGQTGYIGTRELACDENGYVYIPNSVITGVAMSKANHWR